MPHNSFRIFSNFVIKPADKGGSIVIMDREDYISKAKAHLSNELYYKKLSADPTCNIRSTISSYVDHLLVREHITKTMAEFLQPPIQPRTPVFYGLPKIHKENTPLRPIASANDSPTEIMTINGCFHLKLPRRTA